VVKKRQTLKNTIISLPDKFMLFLGRTFRGHTHDYRMLQQELSPDVAWFTDLEVFVDLGYLGLQADDRGGQMEVPHKKPRKRTPPPLPTCATSKTPRIKPSVGSASLASMPLGA